MLRQKYPNPANAKVAAMNFAHGRLLPEKLTAARKIKPGKIKSSKHSLKAANIPKTNDKSSISIAKSAVKKAYIKTTKL